MNAVIYARYSSDNQREESIEGQLRECKEYADQNGITVVRTYIDRALSAKTDSRPQFQQMIHDSATHTFEAVLSWKLDRFSRNRYDSAHYKRILKNNRVHVVSVTEPISNTPEGIMLESLLEGMAEYYSAELAEKVSRGHKENALKAKFNGGPVPLGYRIDSEHHYQIDPNTAPVVQEAFHRYAAGESIRSIIESLNARGIRNSRGNPFTKNSFQTLLKNRRYLGEYRYKDTVIPDAIPAIIDLDCFDAVQRRCEIHRQAPAHNKADVHYLLTTKLFCGKCGAMMAGESGRSHTGTVHCYYKCGTRKRSGKEACSLKPVRKEPLEQFVVQTALEKVLNDRVIDLLADKLLEYQSKENTRLPVLQAELKEVKRRIMLGTFALSSGYYDAYYKKAQQVRSLVTADFNRVFESCDVILSPVAPTPAYKIGEKSADPLEMYMGDAYSVPVNIAGVPALSLPCGTTETGLPIGCQLIGKVFSESLLYRVGAALENARKERM